MSTRLPEARLLLERYISMIKIVSENLNTELEWSLKMAEDFDLETTFNETPIENMTVS
jgi:hypothetical protein